MNRCENSSNVVGGQKTEMLITRGLESTAIEVVDDICHWILIGRYIYLIALFLI